MQAETTEEIHVLQGRVRLLHRKDGGFRTSLDSVMLASACPARIGDHILDMGCGGGAAGLCVAARIGEIRLTGVDIQATAIDLARASAALNQLHPEYIQADIREYIQAYPFDHVICNPPYLEDGTYTPSPDHGRDLALGHHGRDLGLEDWLTHAHRLVRSRGSLTIIHRADHLDRIIRGLGKRFGATEVFPLYPRAGEDAKRVIVRTVKDRRGPLTLHAGLILHEADGTWTTAAAHILNNGAAI